ncbi:sugar phosphate isomerase/epimerase family protein [Chengkuizengella axinellae]|uniref:Sugar phosphate isomerase/epimerase n=1 Tax=Chengkuizengella axinellae TaxID=3064388 RepID=A0ABT9J4P3_9BACL|nr:sugar phosphate isomerase/epimerase [Chengkuizengella sp. 2205SS18-9]MDP5276448.1 sugar phosphate isomerase/epimerase [Chengkuizengella sp. 2205SS18-9]
MTNHISEKYAAQLYTLRNELEQDFLGVLRNLKKMGWKAVQISGLRGHSAEDISAVLKETGLKTAGMHIDIQSISNDLSGVLQLAEQFNTKDLIVPILPDHLRNELGYRMVKNHLNAIAAKIKPLGYTLSYHNHAFEFNTEIEGMDAMSYMLQPTEDNLLLAEIDVYWIKKAGHDPLQFIQRYSNRMPIIHLKDMTTDEHETFAELGTGSIDMVPILQWGEKNGIQYYAVEQDVCPRSPMDCLQTSLDYLMKISEKI